MTAGHRPVGGVSCDICISALVGATAVPAPAADIAAPRPVWRRGRCHRRALRRSPRDGAGPPAPGVAPRARGAALGRPVVAGPSPSLPHFAVLRRRLLSCRVPGSLALAEGD